jgi:hypothetical protein
VNAQISRSAFDHPHVTDPEEQLFIDTAALWSMREDPELAEAATFAFLFFRRRTQILQPDAPPAEEEVRFRRRIDGLTTSIAAKTDEDLDSGLLTAYIMNFAASTWLTWFTMPVGSDDITEEHDMTSDEAQMGIRMVLDHWKSHATDTSIVKNVGHG